MRQLFIYFVISISSMLGSLSGQAVWSKTWDAGGTELANKIKSSHVINDTLYYVTFNVCTEDDQSWYECNTIGMMDKNGDIIKEKLFDYISIKEHGNIPWMILNDKLVLADGSGKDIDASLKIHFINRRTLESDSTYEYKLNLETSSIFINGITQYKDYFILCSSTQMKDTSLYPDLIIWIDKSNMKIDTIMTYPFTKKSVIPEFLFVDPDSLLTLYWSGIDTYESSNGYKLNTRGFLKIDRDKNIVANYMDSIDFSTAHQYAHTALQKSNGDMVYKQDYRKDDQVWPVGWDADFEILCKDKTGGLKWRFSKYGWSPYHLGIKDIGYLTETRDGDILACGFTYWHTNWPTFYEFNDLTDTIIAYPDPDTIGRYDAPYILKLDGNTGELIWQYAIVEYGEHGVTLPIFMRNVHELSDGSLIGTGISQIVDSTGRKIKENAWAFSLPPDGCIESSNMECGFENYIPTSSIDPILINLSNEKPFLVFPNPSTGYYKLIDQRQNMSKVNITVSDINGNILLKTYNTQPTEFDISQFISGTYLLSIYDIDGKKIQNEKIVKW